MKNTTKTIELSKIVIPDLWKIAQIKELQGYTLGGKTAKELIIECWHMAHDFKNQLEQQSELLEALKEYRKAWAFLPANQRQWFIVANNRAHQAISKAEGNA